MRKQVYSLLVDNNPGVLSRIAGLFSRRGYSIDSITAGTTADPRFTRITVVASGDELILSQIENQVRKLEDVIEIKLLKDGESVFRELIMIKIRVTAAQRGEINSIALLCRVLTVDISIYVFTCEFIVAKCPPINLIRAFGFFLERRFTNSSVIISTPLIERFSCKL